MKFTLFLAIASLSLCAQSTGVIEGRVTNSATGEPVGGVTVRFLDRHSYLFSAATDPSGSYRVTGLADGDYRGEFIKDGFADSPQSPFSHVASGLPVSVNAQLKPWGSLRGRVIGEDGKPAAGVRIEKEPNRIGLLDGDTVTDQNGEFAFPNLPAGSYTVVAKPELKTRMQDGVRVGTVAMYYPSATELALAARIPVRLGEQVSGIEIRLKSVPVHRLAGVVLNPAGKPAAHATVKLMGRMGATRQNIGTGMIMPPAGRVVMLPGGTLPGVYSVVGPGPEPEMARVSTKDDGTFEFSAVEPGDWRLSAQAGLENDMPLAGVAPAPVAEKDVENIEIHLSAPFALEVSADWGGPPPPPAPTRIENGRVIATAPATVRVLVTPVDGQPSVVGENYESNMQRMNSVFPGRYRVMQGGGGPAGSFVAAVMWGGRDVSGQVIDLAPGTAPFQMVYRPGLGKVTGTVNLGETKSEAASVFLISRESNENFTYRQVSCSQGGAFDFGEIPPGDYYAVAFDHAADRDGPPAADLQAAMLPLASSVRVDSGATATVELRLNRWPW